MELENVLINKCIEFFNVFIINIQNNNNGYGKLPQYLIIEYNEAVRRTEHHYKLTLKKRWKYCNDTISAESLVGLDEDNLTSGMFYKRVSAQFFEDFEKSKAFVNITFGPKYARGYSFDFLSQDGKYILENEHLEWVS